MHRHLRTYTYPKFDERPNKIIVFHAGIFFFTALNLRVSSDYISVEVGSNGVITKNLISQIMAALKLTIIALIISKFDSDDMI